MMAFPQRCQRPVIDGSHVGLDTTWWQCLIPRCLLAGYVGQTPASSDSISLLSNTMFTEPANEKSQKNWEDWGKAEKSKRQNSGWKSLPAFQAAERLSQGCCARVRQLSALDKSPPCPAPADLIAGRPWCLVPGQRRVEAGSIPATQDRKNLFISVKQFIFLNITG